MNICAVTVAKKFFEYVQAQYLRNAKDVCSIEEDLLAREVFSNFDGVLSNAAFEEEEILEELENSEGSSFSQDAVFDEKGNVIKRQHEENITIQRKIEILKLVKDHPGWSIATLQKKGAKEYKDSRCMKRWSEQIRRGGTRFEQWSFIDEYTYKKFQEARQELKCVTGSQLEIWALQAAQTFKDPSFQFKASSWWIAKFKEKHGISSRKITKLVSKKAVADTDGFLRAAHLFQQEIRTASTSYPPHLVINSDQCGFQYEMTPGRTLSHTGEKLTVAMVKSPTNLATHSYTCQYVISLAGTICGNVFLCLQEPSGRLGDRVKQQLFQPSNVTLTVSHSGKLTTSLYEYFLDNVIARNMNENFLYIVDSWTGQTNVQSYNERFGSENRPNCDLRIIPKNCTGLCQPLDTTFHRQLKYFVRSIYAEYRMNYSGNNSENEEITKRNNIIRTQSLTHNQLMSSIFKPMIQYSWFSSGLTEEKPIFKSVKEVCFSFEKDEGLICSKPLCTNSRFIKCSHCKILLCFVCFYYQFHFHDA